MTDETNNKKTETSGTKEEVNKETLSVNDATSETKSETAVDVKPSEENKKPDVSQKSESSDVKPAKKPYQVKLPEGYKKDEGDDSWAQIEAVFNKEGFKEEDADKIIDVYMQYEINKQKRLETQRLAEIEKLGPNVEQRKKELDAWAQQHFEGEMLETYQQLTHNAKGIKMIEKIKAEMTKSPIGTQSSAVHDESALRTELNELINLSTPPTKTQLARQHELAMQLGKMERDKINS